ncbi:MAG: hypothetical protein DSM106950_40895, partial [Stigonema ocellatum SAG 48.90 = DSM 106950]|nr:hypothetical protein [Stigonema ocellatum SAG 48.90 = DSM 106950]
DNGQLYGRQWATVWQTMGNCMADNGQLYGRQWATVWQTMGNCMADRSAFVVNNELDLAQNNQDNSPDNAQKPHRESVTPTFRYGASSKSRSSNPQSHTS